MFSSLFIICNNFQSVTLILEQIWLGNSEIHLECLFRKITRITESEVIAWLDTNKNKWELDFKKKLSFKAPTVWARVANIPLDQTCTRHVQTNHGDKTNYECNLTYLANGNNLPQASGYFWSVSYPISDFIITYWCKLQLQSSHLALGKEETSTKCTDKNNTWRSTLVYDLANFHHSRLESY